MQIIISIMIAGLLWMIYDLINAPEVDENENEVFQHPDSEDEVDIKEGKPGETNIDRQKEVSDLDA